MKQQSPACCVCVAPADIWQGAEASCQGPLKSRVCGVWFITSIHESDLTETENSCTSTSNQEAFSVMSEKISRTTQGENKGPEETGFTVPMCEYSCYMTYIHPTQQGQGAECCLFWPLKPQLKLSLCEKLVGRTKITKMATPTSVWGQCKEDVQSLCQLQRVSTLTAVSAPVI